MNTKIAITGFVGIVAVIACAIWLKGTSAPRLAPSAPTPRARISEKSSVNIPPTGTTSPRQPIVTAIASTNFWARLDAAAHLPEDLTTAELRGIFGSSEKFMSGMVETIELKLKEELVTHAVGLT